MNNQHGHWICWMSTGDNNGIMRRTHTHTCCKYEPDANKMDRCCIYWQVFLLSALLLVSFLDLCGLLEHAPFSDVSAPSFGVLYTTTNLNQKKRGYLLSATSCRADYQIINTREVTLGESLRLVAAERPHWSQTVYLVPGSN